MNVPIGARSAGLAGSDVSTYERLEALGRELRRPYLMPAGRVALSAGHD